MTDQEIVERLITATEQGKIEWSWRTDLPPGEVGYVYGPMAISRKTGSEKSIQEMDLYFTYLGWNAFPNWNLRNNTRGDRTYTEKLWKLFMCIEASNWSYDKRRESLCSYVDQITGGKLWTS